jgi:gliding motility-associated-like protein
MKIGITFMLLILATFSYTQGLYLSDGAITIQDQSSLTVQGDLIADDNGAVENSGEVNVREDIINNSGGLLFLLDNNGDVYLYGDNQNITGSDSTVFFNLYFQGIDGGVKDFSVPAAVLNELDLNNQVLSSSDTRTYFLNTDPNALYFNTGYITAENLGSYFVRATNQQSEYIFPVGDEGLVPNWRPITITPNDNDSSLFEVRLSPFGADVDASGTSATGATGPFDISQKEAMLGAINTNYYHNVHRLSGSSSADLRFEWSDGDGAFKSIAQLKGTTFRKLDEEFFPAADFGLDKSIIIEDQDDFDHDVFVLADLEIEIAVPNGVSANGDGINDALVIDNLQYFPENNLQVFNRWGDLVFQAQPYENNWDGKSNVSALGGDELVGGTYFFVLELDENTDPIKGYIELKK